MHISHNELYSLCHKAFEGLQVPFGLREDAAHQVTDLEMIAGCGLDFLSRMAEQPHLELPLPKITIHEESPCHIRLSSGGASALLAGPLLADLALVRAHKEGYCLIEAEDLYDPELLLIQVMRCAARGYAAGLWWNTGESCCQVKMTAGDDGPWASAEFGGQAVHRTGPIHFACTKSAKTLDDLMPDIEAFFTEPNVLLEARRQRFRHGLHMPDHLWSCLNGYAERVLVPESDESKERGAGVGADDYD